MDHGRDLAEAGYRLPQGSGLPDHSWPEPSWTDLDLSPGYGAADLP